MLFWPRDGRLLERGRAHSRKYGIAQGPAAQANNKGTLLKALCYSPFLVFLPLLQRLICVPLFPVLAWLVSLPSISTVLPPFVWHTPRLEL